jgi:hypothetical protein
VKGPIGDLAGSVCGGGLQEVVEGHALAVVGDGDAPLGQVEGDAGGVGVEGVFEEFTDDSGGGEGLDGSWAERKC